MATMRSRRWSLLDHRRQIEAARRPIVRQMKRSGQLWIRIFPGPPGDDEASRDAHGRRQGRRGPLCGRGQAGRIMFEIGGVDEETAREACAWRRTNCPSPRSSSRREAFAGGEAVMKAQDLRAMTREELRTRSMRLYQELFNLRFRWRHGN